MLGGDGRGEGGSGSFLKGDKWTSRDGDSGTDVLNSSKLSLYISAQRRCLFIGSLVFLRG